MRKLSGFGRLSSWRKAPTQTTGVGVWFDLSMSPGNPVPNYYIGTPGIFVPLAHRRMAGCTTVATLHRRKNPAPSHRSDADCRSDTAADGAL